MPRETEIVVIGAGPAGAVTAAALAHRGLAVLLVAGDTGPEDHDVLVSGQALHNLAAAGLSVGPAATLVQVVRLSFGPSAGRSITDAGVAVSGRLRLRDTLRRAAIAAGAVQIRGKATSATRAAHGYEVRVAGPGETVMEIAATHVVSATGSAPEPDGPHDAVGLACSQMFAGVTLRRRVVLTMTAPATEPRAMPTCVWALPGGPGTVTVTAASSGAHAVPSPASLIAVALETLAVADPRFAAATPAGPLVAGLLDAGYSPKRLSAADHLLVGDAAGLVNPFTGEGLGCAVHSGLLAARSIARYPSDPDAARREYAYRLSAGFVGFFETARHTARRYHLTWRVLAASAASDHPFFAKARRVTLLPEGMTGLVSADHVDLPPRETIMAAPFLLACDEVAVATVRTEWPFLARLMAAGDDQVSPRLRPAVLFFAALLAGGGPPEGGRATVAAGIELAHLGALSMLGPPPARRAPRRGVDWPVATTILAGDFLLAQASRLVAESAPEASWSFADWMAELTHLRAARLEVNGAAVPAGAMFASLLEFPARIGGLLGGCPAGTVAALRDFGHHCGTAFLHAEDHLALRGERTRLDVTLRIMLEGRISAIPATLGRPDITVHDLAEPRLRAAALTASARACRTARRRALTAAAAVPSPVATLILRRFAASVAHPMETRRS